VLCLSAVIACTVADILETFDTRTDEIRLQADRPRRSYCRKDILDLMNLNLTIDGLNIG
jgi:hypothetical protein